MKNRIAWFKKTYQPGKILDEYIDREFTEVTFKEGGDIITFRIYGTAKDGYKVVER